LTAPPAATSAKNGDTTVLPRRLLAPDAFINPQYARFAIKLTVAVMICYFVLRLADWPGIGTCLPTCFMVALGSVGETVHKATLRIVGCLIGAALGLAGILLLMPLMTDLGQLFLLLAPAILLAAWVGCGSERIAYAGLQIGLAFCLVVLHGTGPTVDMYPAKDRVIGILFGNIVIFVIFTTLWPESVGGVVRSNVAKALEQLGALVGLGAGAGGEISQAARSDANNAFGHAIAQARTLLVNEPFETMLVRRAVPRRLIDATVVAQIGRLFIPVSVLIDLLNLAECEIPRATREAIGAHDYALARWFRQAASWVRSGEGEDELVRGLPEPPVQSGWDDRFAALATWHRILHHDIRQILVDVGVQPQPSITPSAADPFHAAA
jgi:multidrug resistance protein MdtO